MSSIRIGIKHEWPWSRSDWRWFVRHPVKMGRSVRLWAMARALTWIERRQAE